MFDDRHLGVAPDSLERRLIDVLSCQRAIYIELATLAKQQSEYIKTYETEGLMTVLAARNRLLDQIAPLDRQIQPYKNCWQDTLEKCDASARATISMLLTQVRQLLSDILERDETDKDTLVKQKAGVAAELRHTITGGQVNRAYGSRPRVGGATWG